MYKIKTTRINYAMHICNGAGSDLSLPGEVDGEPVLSLSHRELPQEIERPGLQLGVLH